jgi:ribosomal protein S18 acetylase RimI-like enzyme
MTAGEITRRPVRDSDQSFLFELYACTREAELAQVPWTPEQKRAFLTMQFTAQTRGYGEAHPQGVHEIICKAEQAVGRVYSSRKEDRLHILDVTIAPGVRNAGIGSRVLSELFSDADRENKKVTIYVESFNPSLRLFQRLGFNVASQDGFLLLLERPAASGRRESNIPAEADPSDG